MKPVVLERGKDVSSRRFDLAPILRRGTVMEDSNYCFGEGGAGTFSDGKLFTRATKRGPVREVYEIFVAHGAPREILTDAHPHIGSNLLPNVVKAIRESILRAGGEIHFNARVEHLLRSADGRRIRGVACADGREFAADSVLLATGHSARDVYRMMLAEGLALEQKSFAVGVRIEHPQAFVDARQYHLNPEQRRPEQLPAARYSVTTTIQDRGVHSFCMCPGGFIVPAATENDEVVVNGMSLARRDSPFANAGFVVSVHPEDTEPFCREHGVLAGVAYQKALETASCRAGGGMQKAPAQKVEDFLKGRVSSSLLPTSYHPGIVSHPLHELLPEGIVWRMREGLRQFDRKWRGFAGADAQLIGCETRTSSPVRIPRDPATLEHPGLEGLYPCGEGAGYAGRHCFRRPGRTPLCGGHGAAGDPLGFFKRPARRSDAAFLRFWMKIRPCEPCYAETGCHQAGKWGQACFFREGKTVRRGGGRQCCGMRRKGRILLTLRKRFL